MQIDQDDGNQKSQIEQSQTDEETDQIGTEGKVCMKL